MARFGWDDKRAQQTSALQSASKKIPFPDRVQEWGKGVYLFVLTPLSRTPRTQVGIIT